MKPGPSRNFIFKNEIPKSEVIQVRNFMLIMNFLMQVVKSCPQKVRDVIFNNEIPKSEVTKISNFIFNNEITSSGVTKVRNFISIMTCPNQVMKSGPPKWPLDLGHGPETGPDLTTSNFARTGISSHVFVLSSETFQKACTSKVIVKTPRAKRSAQGPR